LGKGGADDVPGQILHGVFIARLNSGPAEDVETRMPPVHEHINHIFGDLE